MAISTKAISAQPSSQVCNTDIQLKGTIISMLIKILSYTEICKQLLIKPLLLWYGNVSLWLITCF